MDWLVAKESWEPEAWNLAFGKAGEGSHHVLLETVLKLIGGLTFLGRVGILNELDDLELSPSSFKGCLDKRFNTFRFVVLLVGDGGGLGCAGDGGACDSGGWNTDRLGCCS